MSSAVHRLAGDHDLHIPQPSIQPEQRDGVQIAQRGPARRQVLPVRVQEAGPQCLSDAGAPVASLGQANVDQGPTYVAKLFAVRSAVSAGSASQIAWLKISTSTSPV